MSFYFTLDTTESFNLQDVLSSLNDPLVTSQNDEEGVIVFYKPGESLRGAILYVQPDHYQIGVNAFTTRYDAELTRDVTVAIASLIGCSVHPEDQSTAIPVNQVAAYCDDDWLDSRFRESQFVMGNGSPETADEPTTLFGYRHPFAVTRSLVDRYTSKGMDTDAALGAIMNDAMALQEYDQNEDVFVPQILDIGPPEPAPKGFLKSMFSRTEEPIEPTTAFVLTEDVRTLTPVIAAHGPICAILGSETLPYHKVPIQLVENAARKVGAREFCVGAFDLTLSGDAYKTLYNQGAPI